MLSRYSLNIYRRQAQLTVALLVSGWMSGEGGGAATSALLGEGTKLIGQGWGAS